jgi:hypothetical protein
VSCIEEICDDAGSDWVTALKKWFMILSPECPRIAFRDELCFALIFLFAVAKQVESSSDIAVSAFCSYIGDQHILSHWSRSELNPHYELAFYHSFSEIVRQKIW